jgi:hypothetical protein
MIAIWWARETLPRSSRAHARADSKSVCAARAWNRQSPKFNVAGWPLVLPNARATPTTPVASLHQVSAAWREIHCEHYCSAAILPMRHNRSGGIFISAAGSAAKLKFDNGQERDQFAEVDRQLCILDLRSWRSHAADPLGALRLEGLLIWCGRDNRL